MSLVHCEWTLSTEMGKRLSFRMKDEIGLVFEATAKHRKLNGISFLSLGVSASQSRPESARTLIESLD